ncbi:DUF411 domain-containing protein [Neptunicoccus cionae]|uniref:DUF411 domain-containing protein n=1 Tax=Neptunicoccus cionae TaxID=2035344 RepID=UPI000C75DA77|nr:DUF411 domain-containing protein [Amylibacter cionae]PLS21379.1 metal-binding protein [Amylibacter cionae]
MTIKFNKTRKLAALGTAAATLAVFAAVSLGSGPAAVSAQEVKLYKDPSCGCCEVHGEYLREHGFDVEIIPTHDLSEINRKAGIAEGLQGCHTALIGDYAVSGHVPVSVIEKMLAEKPDIAAISLPGMPQGSPGMGGSKQEPFTVYSMKAGSAPQVYAVE